MKNLFDIAELKKPATIPEYFKSYKKLMTALMKANFNEWPHIKIAIVTSFTTNGIEEILTVKCCEQGIIPEIYLAPYNQYNQEILNPGSGLFTFRPDLIIVYIDTRSIMEGRFLNPYKTDNRERKNWVDTTAKHLIMLVTQIKQHSPAKIVFHNFEVPLHSPLGILENKQEFGFFESIEYLNNFIRDKFKRDSQVFVFDYNAFCSRYGKQDLVNYKLYYMADIKLDLEYLPLLADEYLAYIKPVLSKAKKCIVLDLDNTLWGGIIGEDGIAGIHLGPIPEGRSFWEFQAYLLALFNRGIILAINSKNNLDDALAVFRNHPYMILKEQHFAAIRINWDDKVSNMIEIARELNIGLDAMIFLDDDKLNREMIAAELPDVLVVDMPEDSTLYLKTLAELTDFNTLQITEEDLSKGKMYAEQRQRDEFQKTVRDISEYLRELDMIVTIEKGTSITIPRISQLTQKTNQFNLTTRRYLEEDIRRFSEDKNWLVLCVDVKDKFGDNGITGVMIVSMKKEEWHIDSLLLSCRIIGRNVEGALFSYLVEEAKKKGAKQISGMYIPTKKNAPAKDFYKRHGFTLKIKTDVEENWVFDLNTPFTGPDYIRVIAR